MPADQNQSHGLFDTACFITYVGLRIVALLVGVVVGTGFVIGLFNTSPLAAITLAMGGLIAWQLSRISTEMRRRRVAEEIAHFNARMRGEIE